MKGFAVIALLVSGVAVAVLSGRECEEKKVQQSSSKLKVCTPYEKMRVQELLQRSRRATRAQIKDVLYELDSTLEKELDCGWESVKDARADLSSRLQP